MPKFSTVKATLDEIAERIQQNRRQVAQATDDITAVDSDLGAMPTVYATIVSGIDDDAAAAPGDDLLRLVKEEKDKLVDEFTTMKTSVADIKAAIDAIIF